MCACDATFFSHIATGTQASTDASQVSKPPPRLVAACKKKKKKMLVVLSFVAVQDFESAHSRTMETQRRGMTMTELVRAHVGFCWR